MIAMSHEPVYLEERFIKGGYSSMMSPTQLEEAFLDFSQNLNKHAPDGVIVVDLHMLHDLGLLNHKEFSQGSSHEDLMHYFHVLETADKVTLFNEQFAIWILPQISNEISITLTFIALLQQDKPHLELVFSTSGVYNSPKFILKILEHFLMEVTDTEALISAMNRPKNS